ncbi:5142_t:CDS:1, partial [Acaulospora morrowiae]
MKLSNTHENQIKISTEHDFSIRKYQVSSIEVSLIKPSSIKLLSFKLSSIELPSIELLLIELLSIELPLFEFSSIELSSFEFPSIELLSIELSLFEFPSIELLSFKFEDIKNSQTIIRIIGLLVISRFVPAMSLAAIYAIGFSISGIVKGSFAVTIMASYGRHVFIQSLCTLLQNT